MKFDFKTLPHHWVNRFAFLLRKELQERFRQAGQDITAEEWAVLLLLWQQNGRGPAELADLTVRDRTTMTRLLDAMERKGLVGRKTDLKDRRRMLVTLTSKGRDLQAVLVPQAQALIGRTLKGIPEENIATTLSTLRQMTENLQKTGG